MPDETRGMVALAASAAESLFPDSVEGLEPRLDRRVATVLFADIVGSSRLVAEADPEDAQETLSLVLGAMAPHVARFGGTLCQTLGDGILAVFGAPDALEHHAVRACYAAEAMIRAVRREKRTRIAVRVGICTGEIMWDGTALNRNDRPPAVGRAVHMAARLQQAAPPNRARLSDATATRVADWIDIEPAGPVRMTGEETFESFDLLGPYTRRRRRTDDRIPTFGRDGELALLTDGLHRAAEGRGGACLLTGAPGLGKSRLADEAVKVAHRARLRVVEWQMHAVRPIAAPDPLSEITGLLLDAPSLPTERAVLLGQMAALGVAGPRADALADILIPSQRRAGMDPQGVLALATEGVADLALSIALDEPMLLLVEDLHWAGPEARAVLEALGPRLGERGLYLLATSRTDEPWMRFADRRGLGPMTGEAATALLDALMGGDPRLAELKEAVRGRAQGNPFYVTECVRALVQDGALAGTTGDLHPTGKPAERMPEDIQVLLVSRIDALPPAPRTLLLTAAAVGQTVDAALLRALDGSASFEGRLETLVNGGFLDPASLTPRPEYAFRHALMQEAGYATLTRKNRKRLHGQVADLLDTPDFADLPNRLALLARHAYKAEMWDRAADAGFEAGKQSVDSADYQTAADLLDLSAKSHEYMGGRDQDVVKRFELHYALARSAVPMGIGDKANIHLELARFLSGTINDPLKNVKLSLMSASHEFAFGSIESCIAEIRHAKEVFLSFSQNGEDHPQILAMLGSALLEAGIFGEAEIHLMSAWKSHCTKLPVRFAAMDMSTVALAKLAVLAAFQQDEVTAEQYCMRATALAAASSFPGDIVITGTYCTEATMLLGAWRQTTDIANRAINAIGPTSFGIMRPVATARRACAALMMGGSASRSRQLHSIRESRALAEAKGLHGHLPKIDICLAEALFRTGAIAEAKDIAQAAIERASASGAKLSALILMRMLNSSNAGTFT